MANVTCPSKGNEHIRWHAAPVDKKHDHIMSLHVVIAASYVQGMHDNSKWLFLYQIRTIPKA